MKLSKKIDTELFSRPLHTQYIVSNPIRDDRCDDNQTIRNHTN